MFFNRYLFDVGINDGRIIVYFGLDSGSYIVNVSVLDKKNIVYGIVKVDVLLIFIVMLDFLVIV